VIVAVGDVSARKTKARAPRIKVTNPKRAKTRPILRPPTICSPQVFFRSLELRLSASMGPKSSVTRTGTAKKVARLQAIPTREDARTLIRARGFPFPSDNPAPG